MWCISQWIRVANDFQKKVEIDTLTKLDIDTLKVIAFKIIHQDTR